jgi:hypothetical protein
MQIAYVGNRKNLASDGKSFNTESHICQTLEKLGHEVNFIQEDEITHLPSQVGEPDLFLWTRTYPGKVTLEALRAIEAKGIPTVSFHLDKYAGIQRDGGLGEDVFWKTQFVFSPEGSVQSKRIFDELGINQFYLPPAVYEEECYIAEPVEHFKHDIVFVGGGVEYSHPEWPYRGKLVTWLKETYGDRFSKYGWPERPIRGEELNQLYSSSKIVIGDSLCKDFIDSYYFSDRCFETTGRGGFLITPYIPGMSDHYVDRKEAVFYAFDNFVQLKNLIDYYLEHDEEREAIRKAGVARTFKDNTYIQRMKQMLSIIFGGREAGAELPTHSAPASLPPETKDMQKKDRSRFNGLRGEIFKRDNYQCVNCGMTMSDHLEKYNKSLTIDHIDGQGRNSKEPNNDPTNLQTLCLPCHGKKDGPRWMVDKPLKISLGAGTEPEEGFTNVDIVQLEGIDVVHNLMRYPWPFEDSCAEYIKAKDIIEHMATHLPDGRSSLIAFIEECHRILQPGGKLWIQTPRYDADFLYIDPTHVRGYHENSMDFFDDNTDFGRATGFYSDAKFDVTCTVSENKNLVFEMVKR